MADYDWKQWQQYAKPKAQSTAPGNEAIIEIRAGAGGEESALFGMELYQMYRKYAVSKGWHASVIDSSETSIGGLKYVAFYLSGPGAYDAIKNESGVHRLVRISPFSSKSLRHTSFALVEIMPIITTPQFKINPRDLRIDTFRSSGPGGQNVNKLETAVRVTHIPSGISVSVQSERSQAQNKDKAMQLLYSRLAQKLEQAKIKELSELKPELKSGSIEWGSQIRSYVLHPYQMVKDHRTGVKSSQPDKVLDGELDKFLEIKQ
ncbi:MAG: peptide chain release factor-like protein [Patescibacteria group bacterium]